MARSGPMRSQARPQVDTPVDADDVAAGGRHRADELRIAGAEVDDGHTRRQRPDERRRVGSGITTIVVRREAADPGVENLDGLRARVDLAPQIRREAAGEEREERVPGPLVGAHERLGAGEGTGGSPLDQVGGDGERRPGEADQRQIVRQLGTRPPHTVIDVGERVGIDFRQGVDHAPIPDRRGDHRPRAGAELEPQSERLDRQEQVGEQDRGIDPEPSGREHRGFADQIGRPAELEHRHPLAQPAVLRHVAARLPHQPDGRERHRLAPAGAQENGCVRRVQGADDSA